MSNTKGAIPVPSASQNPEFRSEKKPTPSKFLEPIRTRRVVKQDEGDVQKFYDRKAELRRSMENRLHYDKKPLSQNRQAQFIMKQKIDELNEM